MPDRAEGILQQDAFEINSALIKLWLAYATLALIAALMSLKHLQDLLDENSHRNDASLFSCRMAGFKLIITQFGENSHYHAAF